MATTKKLVIEVDTPKGGSKKIEIDHPKAGITKAQASTFAEKLYEDDIFDPNTVGAANGLIGAYYVVTTTTDLT